MPKKTVVIDPEAAARLRWARELRLYPSASDAARAIGAPVPTYIAHENATRGFANEAVRYAEFFRVSLEWLMTGRGSPRPRYTLPLHGEVGAGDVVELIERMAGERPVDIAIPDESGAALLRVAGMSQYPRFLPGEFIIYDPTPVDPARLVGHYAVVQTKDGARLIKILRRGQGDNRWRLESHNAPPIEQVELMGAWRYLGTLTAP